MKIKINYFLITYILINCIALFANPEISGDYNNFDTADKILAIIYHPNGSHLILQSDLMSNIDDIAMDKETAIFRKLVEIDAQIMQVNISQEEVDRQWAKIQKDCNLTQDQLLEKKKPFTLEQIRQEIEKDLMVQAMLNHRVYSRVIVDKSDIENYCKEHPVYKEATYTISQGSVKLDVGSAAIKRIKLTRAIEYGEIDQMATWLEPIELKDSQIAQDKAYIKNLGQNQDNIVILESDHDNPNNSINLIRLISKTESRVLDYKEREVEVYNLLCQEKYKRLFEEYKAKLFGQYRLESEISQDSKIAVIKYID